MSFSGDIPDEHVSGNSFFPDEYFTCSSTCLSCGYVRLSWLLEKVKTCCLTGFLGGPLSAQAVKEA